MVKPVKRNASSVSSQSEGTTSSDGPSTPTRRSYGAGAAGSPLEELPRRGREGSSQSRPRSQSPLQTDFTEHERAQFARNMQPTPLGWRDNMLAQFEEPVQIGFGMEVEIGHAHYTQKGLPKKADLGDVPGFNVQTDQPLRNPLTTYPELVQTPRRDWPTVKNDLVNGATAFGDRLVSQTFVRGRAETTLAEIVPQVKPQHANLGIRMSAPLPTTTLHATGGVKENDIRAMFQAYIEPEKLYAMDDVIERLEERLGERLAELKLDRKNLSPDLRGFLSSIVMATLETGTKMPEELTPHAFFMFCHRSSFSWRYYQNLQTPEERAIARAVLLKPSEQRPSLLSEALKDITGRGGNDYIFAELYAGPLKPDNTYDKFPGPTHDEFFESIVKRPYDLLSDVEGYGRGSALGVWGSGDLERHAAGYELRNAQLKPSSNTLLHVGERLYNFFAKFNPDLRPSGASGLDQMMAEVHLRNMTMAVDDFNAFHREFEQARRSASGPQDPGVEFGRRIQQDPSAVLPTLGAVLASKADDADWKEPHDAYRAVMTYLQGEPSSLKASDIDSRLIRLGKALWDCDEHGSGREARQAASTVARTGE